MIYATADAVLPLTLIEVSSDERKAMSRRPLSLSSHRLIFVSAGTSVVASRLLKFCR